MNRQTTALKSPAVVPPSPKPSAGKAGGGEGLSQDHPLAGTFGAFQDDPMLDLMIENIQVYRRRVDQEEDATE